MAGKIYEIVTVIDQSGSMSSISESTIRGFNSLLEEQKSRKEEIVFTTVVFNDRVRTVCDRVPISQVEPLDEKSYDPAGCTALLDAVGSAVMHIDSMHVGREEEYKTIVFIITDGYENASTYHTYDSVKKLIKDKEAEGWTFKYLGSEIDVKKEAAKMGIRANDAQEFDHTDEGMLCCCRIMNNSIDSCIDN